VPCVSISPSHTRYFVTAAHPLNSACASFCRRIALGPTFVTSDELTDPNSLRIECANQLPTLDGAACQYLYRLQSKDWESDAPCLRPQMRVVPARVLTFVVFRRTFVNGVSKQDSNTADMIFNCREIIEWLSTDTTLLPGTVILTGTVSSARPAD
jgi:hypothetical protein